MAGGGKDSRTGKALLEADGKPGPSSVIAYSHCIEHGYDRVRGMEQQRLAVESGIWPLYRVDPARGALGEPAMTIDMGGTPKRTVWEYTQNESRFRMVEKIDPKRFARLQVQAQNDAARRTEIYRQMAEMRVKPPAPTTTENGGEK